MSNKRWRLVFAVSGLLGLSGAAFAQSPWDETHGRRDEVNDRLAHQNERIGEERREHELSAERARELHRKEARVRAEERSMAARDRDHMTRHYQHVLNEREDHARQEIPR